MDSKTSKQLIWGALLFLVGLAIYAPGLHIPYYADDFQFVFDRSSLYTVGSFFYTNIAENDFYRPLQASFMWVVQQEFGLDTFLVHLVQVLMHVLFSWLVYRFLLDLRFSRVQAALASLFMLVSQANVHAVLSNDTLSQVGSGLFGYLAIWSIYRAHASSNGPEGGGPPGNRANLFSILGLVALALSYLSKENGITFFPLVMVVIAVMAYQEGTSSMVSKIIRRGAPVVLLTIAYLVARSLIVDAQPTIGEERYDFHFGANIIQNVLMLGFAASVPVSSVKAYVALKIGSFGAIALILAATLALLAAVAYGLWLVRERYRSFLLWAVLFFVGLFPMVLLNHVSELYIYNCMPIAAAFFGVAMGTWLEKVRERRAAYYAVIAFILLVFTSHLVAVQSKTNLMKEAGAQSDALLNQIQPFLKDVPVDGRLILVNKGDELDYSVFQMTGFRTLDHGLHRLNQLAGRDDFRTYIIGAQNSGEDVINDRSLLLALHDGVVERVLTAR